MLKEGSADAYHAVRHWYLCLDYSCSVGQTARVIIVFSLSLSLSLSPRKKKTQPLFGPRTTLPVLLQTSRISSLHQLQLSQQQAAPRSLVGTAAATNPKHLSNWSITTKHIPLSGGTSIRKRDDAFGA